MTTKDFTNKDFTNKEMNGSSIKAFLSGAGYSDGQIAQGFEYAESVGYSSNDELAQLAVSRILYTDAQLADGDRIGWEQVDWQSRHN